MKKGKRKLKTWVKVAIIVIIDIVIYHLCGKYGYIASESNFGAMLIIMGWTYLFLGQFALATIWCPELDF